MTSTLIPYASGELEREVVLSRMIDAHRDRVFQAWIEPERMFQWFGPSGFHCEIREAGAPHVGGAWRFDMVAPDGHRYDSRMVFLEIVPNERIVVEHGADQDQDPGRFRMTLTFDAQANGKTVLTLRQFHPSAAQRDRVIGFGAVEMGYQTLDKLAAYLGAGQ